MNLFVLTPLLALPLLLAPPLAAQPPTPDALDEVLRDALDAWNVPGVAVAVVHNDKVVYLKGFGVRKLGGKEPVTPDTVFPIASCTKTFTTLAMAMLVDEGKLAWDDPVRKHLDYFRLGDPLADAQVTLRDLVCHRTGLASRDELWYRAPWSLEERIRKAGKLPLDRSFRSAFQYQTTLFGAAGVAAGRAGGGTWEELVRRRVVEPLGMKSVTFTTGPALKAADHAAGHRKRRGGRVEPIDWYPIDEPDPAGSMNASVRDLSRFLRLQLGGTWQGRRLVSAEELAETHTPQVPIRLAGFARALNPDTLQLSYGMGWVVQDHRGHLLVMHGGAIDGFRAHLTLVPHARLGIALLNNRHQTYMNLAVSHRLVDMFLGLPPRDWNGYLKEVLKADEAYGRNRLKAIHAARHPNTKPSRDLSAYAGSYSDPAYGTARVTLEGGKLHWQWSSFRVPLEHFHYDTFLLDIEVVSDAPVTFALGADGEVASMRALERDFKRVP